VGFQGVLHGFDGRKPVRRAEWGGFAKAAVGGGRWAWVPCFEQEVREERETGKRREKNYGWTDDGFCSLGPEKRFFNTNWRRISENFHEWAPRCA
jgi:hypothetical protein